MCKTARTRTIVALVLEKTIFELIRKNLRLFIKLKTSFLTEKTIVLSIDKTIVWSIKEKIVLNTKKNHTMKQNNFFLIELSPIGGGLGPLPRLGQPIADGDDVRLM